MGLVSLENQVKIQAYWDAFRTGGLQSALFPDNRSSQELLTDLQSAVEKGNIALAASDTIHLLRRDSTLAKNGALAMAQVHERALKQYTNLHDAEEHVEITNPLDFMRREVREARLETAAHQVARRNLHWSKIVMQFLDKNSVKATSPINI